MKLNVTFINKKNDRFYTLSLTQHAEKNDIHVFVRNEEGEGGQFQADEVCDVIFNAIDRYFRKNF